MTALVTVRHVPGSAPPWFEVIGEDGQAAAARPVPPAAGYPVTGRPGCELMEELRWYLEDFLAYPFSPETEHAEQALAALERWGREAYAALFGNSDGGTVVHAAALQDLEALRLQVRSNDPAVLAWPWEALHDPRAGPLGQAAQLERRLDAPLDPRPLGDLPQERLHILLVTARPYERDVGFRSISRPLVDLVATGGVPAEVHLLRPPTLVRLREHLRERPRYYHVFHFDGHGAYRTGAAARGASAAGGSLAFESAAGGPVEVAAADLAALLHEAPVPVVVLNACQSGMLDSGAPNAFASVAGALLQSGARAVVAMAYSLHVSGAQEFLPAFYRRLFDTGIVAEAVRAGRQAMRLKPGRVCARGRFPLNDWLLPVVYQHEDVDLSFPVRTARKVHAGSASAEDVPPTGDSGLDSFVGRDGPLLRLERALRLEPAAVLIHGLGGIGKTTLARGFLEWLRMTGGLGGRDPLWFSFEAIWSADYVLNRLGECLAGPDFALLPRPDKITVLGRRLGEERTLIVWDDFEAVSGLPGTGYAAALPAQDRTDLHDLLRAMRGGASKVIIASRGAEGWLAGECTEVSLGGLQGEERWEYCNRILEELGLRVDRDDADLGRLMDLLEGHPLLMRVVLQQLRIRTPGELIAALCSHPAAIGSGESAGEERLYAPLRLLEESLPPALRPLLLPLAFHQRFLRSDSLLDMARSVDDAWLPEPIDALLATLVVAGLAHRCDDATYGIHPLLSGFLRATVLARADVAARNAWAEAFAKVISRLADRLAPRPLHEQRRPFEDHQVNFLSALVEAESLGLLVAQAALLQGLGANAQNTHRWPEAAELFRRLAKVQMSRGNPKGEAGAYHQLGMIAQEQRNFVVADEWYQKALAIYERLPAESAGAPTYHQLGMVAQAQENLAAAERWYLKCLAISERLGNAREAASTYHQLGVLAGLEGDAAAAERWYRKSLAVETRIGNRVGMDAPCHQLGRLCEASGRLDEAERWYRESLAIDEDFGNEPGIAMTCRHLGRVAQARRNFTAARQYYLRSLEICERRRDERTAGTLCSQLVTLAVDQGRFEEATRWLVRALQSFERAGEAAGVEKAKAAFAAVLGVVPPTERQVLLSLWRRTGLAEPPGI